MVGPAVPPFCRTDMAHWMIICGLIAWSYDPCISCCFWLCSRHRWWFNMSRYKKVFGFKTWMLPISASKIARELTARQPRSCYYSNKTHIFTRVNFLFDFEICCAEDIGQHLNIANFDLWKDGGKGWGLRFAKSLQTCSGKDLCPEGGKAYSSNPQRNEPSSPRVFVLASPEETAKPRSSSVSSIIYHHRGRTCTRNDESQ